MKIDKLRWRFDVLFSKIRGREVLEWSYIFKELFKKHPSKSVSLQLGGCPKRRRISVAHPTSLFHANAPSWDFIPSIFRDNASLKIGMSLYPFIL